MLVKAIVEFSNIGVPVAIRDIFKKNIKINYIFIIIIYYHKKVLICLLPLFNAALVASVDVPV